MEALDVGVVALCLAVLAGVIARGIQKKRHNYETPLVVLVKRRRTLAAQLNGLMGDRIAASRLVQAEAQRLGASPTSVEVLEAAVLRATSLAHGTSPAK